VHAWWNGARIMTDDDARVDQVMQINNHIGAWSQAADVDRDLARRWDRLHWLRVAILVVLFVLLVIGVRPVTSA
jgi:hypothetical protein